MSEILKEKKIVCGIGKLFLLFSGEKIIYDSLKNTSRENISTKTIYNYNQCNMCS